MQQQAAQLRCHGLPAGPQAEMEALMQRLAADLDARSAELADKEQALQAELAASRAALQGELSSERYRLAADMQVRRRPQSGALTAVQPVVLAFLTSAAAPGHTGSCTQASRSARAGSQASLGWTLPSAGRRNGGGEQAVLPLSRAQDFRCTLRSSPALLSRLALQVAEVKAAADIELKSRLLEASLEELQRREAAAEAREAQLGEAERRLASAEAREAAALEQDGAALQAEGRELQALRQQLQEQQDRWAPAWRRPSREPCLPLGHG
jgi:hypothetical protein